MILCAPFLVISLTSTPASSPPPRQDPLNPRIQPLGVLSDDDEVDVLGTLHGKWRLHPVHQLDWSNVDIEVKAPSEAEDDIPSDRTSFLSNNLRQTYRTKKDCVSLDTLFERLLVPFP